MVDNKIKIRLFGEHLCYIETDILREFQNRFSIININSWIKEECYKDFEILIENPDNLDELRNIVKVNYYSNIGDWLREKIRNKLRGLS